MLRSGAQSRRTRVHAGARVRIWSDRHVFLVEAGATVGTRSMGRMDV